MNKNTINERKNTDIGTGVQVAKYFNHNSPASLGSKLKRRPHAVTTQISHNNVVRCD